MFEMSRPRADRAWKIVLTCVAACLLLPGLASADPCVVTETGGTIELPPAGCDYLSPDEVHEILDGLPVPSTIVLASIHKDFICNGQRPFCSQALAAGICEEPGGDLGGNLDCFDSALEMTISGTDLLAGFNRFIALQIETEIHTGPRTPGEAVQSFDTDLFRLQGQLFGDPDFCTLQIIGGTAHGFPSPGHTILTDLEDGTFNVDSFFDVAYEITYVGCPGSILDGFSGTTQGTLRMETGDPIVNPATPAIGPYGLIALAGGLLLGGAVMSRRFRS